MHNKILIIWLIRSSSCMEQSGRTGWIIDYMKSTYPDTAKRVLPLVEEECDRLEYSSSMIYDEYPDRLQLRFMTKRIYERAQEEGRNPGVSAFDIIQVMLCQELLLRRHERREKRKFY